MTQPNLLMTVDQWATTDEYNTLVMLSDEYADADYNATNMYAANRSYLETVWSDSMEDYAGNWMDITFADDSNRTTAGMNVADSLLEEESKLHMNGLYFPTRAPSETVFLIFNLSAYHGMLIH